MDFHFSVCFLLGASSSLLRSCRPCPKVIISRLIPVTTGDCDRKMPVSHNFQANTSDDGGRHDREMAEKCR